MQIKDRMLGEQPKMNGYRAPKLYVYGAMRELTASGTVGVLESKQAGKGGNPLEPDQRG